MSLPGRTGAVGLSGLPAPPPSGSSHLPLMSRFASGAPRPATRL